MPSFLFFSHQGGKGNYTVKTLEVYTVKTLEVYTVKTLEVFILSKSLEVIKTYNPQHMSSCKYTVLKHNQLTQSVSLS